MSDCYQEYIFDEIPVTGSRQRLFLDVIPTWQPPGNHHSQNCRAGPNNFQTPVRFIRNHHPFPFSAGNADRNRYQRVSNPGKRKPLKISQYRLVSILRGLLIFLLIVLVNPFIATFFKAPDSRLYLYAISLVPLLRGFINPACIKLQKELLFRLEFLYRFAIIGFETLVTIVISFFYPTAMALIVGLILSAFLEVSLSFILFSPRPIWGFDSRQFKIILHRGKWITGMGILDYLFTTGDNIIVGRLLGTGALGVYQNAYKISTIPTFETQDIFYKVTFPVYVKANMAFGLNRRLLIRNVAFYCLIVTVFGLVVSLMAKPLVHILLGPDWSEAVPVVRILGILGISRGISFSFNSIFMTFQKQKYVTLIILTSVLGLALTIVPAVTRFGLSGAGISAVFGSLLSLPLALYFAVRIISRL